MERCGTDAFEGIKNMSTAPRMNPPQNHVVCSLLSNLLKKDFDKPEDPVGNDKTRSDDEGDVDCSPSSSLELEVELNSIAVFVVMFLLFVGLFW